MGFNEMKWQAESDARTLAEYQAIMSDSKRKSRAMSEARKQANDLEKRLKTMRAVSSKNKKK